jgi:hypothetical protein
MQKMGDHAQLGGNTFDEFHLIAAVEKVLGSSRSTMSLAFHPACAATAAYALVATLVEFPPDDCVIVVGLRP